MAKPWTLASKIGVSLVTSAIIGHVGAFLVEGLDRHTVGVAMCIDALVFGIGAAIWFGAQADS